MPSAIQVSHLNQGYGSTPVLSDISLTVETGTILGLIGPSGAGKTTLVNTLMGMQPAKKGSVQVLGQPMPNRALLASIGYMAQTDALYTDLTAKENLLFFGAMQGQSQSQLEKALPHALAVVNLTSAVDKFVRDYSGGMKRRLSLAIALLTDPPLLILDEPTVGIDPALRQQIWQELHRLAKAQKTIVLTTHVMADAEESDQLMMIRNGRAIAQGTPASLKQEYGVDSVEQVFLKAGRLQDADSRNDAARL